CDPALLDVAPPDNSRKIHAFRRRAAPYRVGELTPGRAVAVDDFDARGHKPHVFRLSGCVINITGILIVGDGTGVLPSRPRRNGASAAAGLATFRNTERRADDWK